MGYIEDENKFGFDKYKAELRRKSKAIFQKSTLKIGNVCVILGAGRNVKTDNIDLTGRNTFQVSKKVIT